MNWAVFALSVSAVLAAIWLWLVTRRNWSAAGLYASLGCLVAACFNAAAPVRGALDPNYLGYQFGLAGSEKGLGVTMVAGAIFLSSALSALLAASRQEGRELWIVALTSAAMFIVIGVPTLQQAVLDPSANVIQFGEYLTIPGMAATAIQILLLAIPFAVGAVWAASAAMASRN